MATGEERPRVSDNWPAFAASSTVLEPDTGVVDEDEDFVFPSGGAGDAASSGGEDERDSKALGPPAAVDARQETVSTPSEELVQDVTQCAQDDLQGLCSDSALASFGKDGHQVNERAQDVCHATCPELSAPSGETHVQEGHQCASEVGQAVDHRAPEFDEEEVAAVDAAQTDDHRDGIGSLQMLDGGTDLGAEPVVGPMCEGPTHDDSGHRQHPNVTRILEVQAESERGDAGMVELQEESERGDAGMVELQEEGSKDAQLSGASPIGETTTQSDLIPGAVQCDKDARIAELRNQVQHRRDSLAQLRMDYNARVQRSSELRAAVEMRKQAMVESSSGLSAAVEKVRAQISEQRLLACRAQMTSEDRLSRGVQLLVARDEDIRLLEQRVHQQQQIYQRLLQAREPDNYSVLQEVLQTRAKQIEALKREVASQQQTMQLLCSDLRRLLDFMMRVNIEAAAGPARNLTEEDFLPRKIRDSLQWSEKGAECFQDLVRKYDECMSQCEEPAVASTAEVPTENGDFLRDAFESNRGDSVPSSAMPLPLPRPASAPTDNGCVVPSGGAPMTERSVSSVTQKPAPSGSAAGGDRYHRPYRCIQALGGQKPKSRGILSAAAKMLRAPVRDATSFMKQRQCEALKRLSHSEKELGVWSDWVFNYTHDGLLAAFETSRPANASARPGLSKQVAVLTCERLFLFDGISWAVGLEVSISQVEEILVSAFGTTVVVVRLRRRPDVILDLEARDRFVDELMLASRRCGGGPLEGRAGGINDGMARITAAAEPLTALLDEHRSQVGTLAYVEQNVFLLLSFSPESLLHSGSETLFIGFLEVQAAIGSGSSSAFAGWHLFFFLLKGGTSRAQRQLAWCHHPCDQQPAGCLSGDSIAEVRPLDNPDGEHCLVIERTVKRLSTAPSQSLTLRAASAKSRQDWLTAISTVCCGR